MAAVGGCGLPGEDMSLIAASELKPAGSKESPREGKGRGWDHELRLGFLSWARTRLILGNDVSQ